MCKSDTSKEHVNAASIDETEMLLLILVPGRKVFQF